MRVGNRSQAGFTLIEMLLVVVIIGILAGMIIPSYVGRSREARHKAAWGDIHMLKAQVGIFEMDNGRFPNNLTEMLNPPGRYFQPDEDLLDPWGEPYIYSSSGNTFTISYSRAAEGQEFKP